MESSLTPTNSTSIDSSSSSSSLCSPASSSMVTQPSHPFFFGRRVFVKKSKPQHPHEETADESKAYIESSPPCFFFPSRKTPPTTTDSEDSSAATTLKRKECGLDDSIVYATAKNKLAKFDSPRESCLDTKDAGEEKVLTELPLFPGFQKNNGISSSTVTPKKSVSDNLPNLAKFKNCRYGRDEELQMRFDTELRLNIDPWLIKRRLTPSDIGPLSRLLVETKLVQAHILPVVGPVRANQIHTEMGLQVTILDLDTAGSRHEVIFKKWLKPSSYVFIAGWREQFVKRRELEKGDEIGLLWDAHNSRFYFSVLARAAVPLRH